MTDECIASGSRTMRVKAGEEFRISLKGNATTGFDWVVEAPEGVRLLSDRYVPDEDKAHMCGAGGVHEFVLVCEREGSFELVFDYQRSWEGSEGNTLKMTVIAERSFPAEVV